MLHLLRSGRLVSLAMLLLVVVAWPAFPSHGEALASDAPSIGVAAFHGTRVVTFLGQPGTTQIVEDTSYDPSSAESVTVGPGSDGEEQVFLRVGDTTTHYIPSLVKAITVSGDYGVNLPLLTIAYLERLREPSSTVEWRFVGNSAFLDRPVEVWQLMDPQANPSNYTMWIDVETGAPLKIEAYAAPRGLVWVMSYAEFFEGLEQGQSSLELPLETRIYDDVEEFRRDVTIEQLTSELGWRPLSPKAVPRGYELIDGTVRTVGKARLAQLRLRLSAPGGAEVSLFIRRIDKDARVANVARDVLASLEKQYGRKLSIEMVRRGEFLFAVVGDADTKDLSELVSQVSTGSEAP